jgi:hypothetical protein
MHGGLAVADEADALFHNRSNLPSSAQQELVGQSFENLSLTLLHSGKAKQYHIVSSL